MGYKEIEIKVDLKASGSEIRSIIAKKSGIKNFTYQVLRKSLDARNKRNIHWQYRVGVSSGNIKDGEKPEIPFIDIPRKNYESRALVTGSGPAGIFCALVLAEAGMKVTLIEQGSQVQKRKQGIEYFEAHAKLDENNNYAFGEGGAGTFSDGKLTSRTKGISKEKNYIFQSFIEAGAPGEIMYMTHPHLGSDNLFTMTCNLREKLINLGGEIIFDTKLENISVSGDYVVKAITGSGIIEAEHFVIASGHSSYETYKMLIRNKVPFRTKNFAIGMRAEHRQELINYAQWGVEKLPGLKAAEYRLTANDKVKKPVYSFCMCPGGVVVPATPYKHTNIVNGMSLYKRGNKYANAAVVAGVHPDELLGKQASPIEALEWLEALEHKFYLHSKSYSAPAVKIIDFINNRTSQKLKETSYPLGLSEADIYSLLPSAVTTSLKEGLLVFMRKLKGYEMGKLIGLESKTSSPVQVVRDKVTLLSGYFNLYVAGEGSGWAGGIISSAADGVRVALSILDRAK